MAGGKPYFGPVDGSGLPVILAEDRGFGTDIRREAVIDASDSGGHLLPAELVGEDLRQRAELVCFDRGMGQVQGLRVTDVRLGRQDGNGQRRENSGGGGQQRWPSESQLQRPQRVEAKLPDNAAGGEQDQKTGKR
jgi:hypothetical protein